MMQSETERRAYLRAMGIDVWVPRDEPDVESAVVAPELANRREWMHALPAA